MDDQTLSTVFGTLGAVCWSIQLTPQILLNWRRSSASGLSSNFMLFWAGAGIPLGVYNIVSGFNIALQVQPQILTTLSLITAGQCYYYERKWSFTKVLALIIPTGISLAGLEVGLIFALRHGLGNGTQWPLTLMAVLAASMLALGVCEQYFAIWKNKSVEGISFIFCALDAAGDLTSIISVLFRARLDILGLVVYGVELGLWMGIFAFGCYFKLVPFILSKIQRQRQRQNNRTRQPDQLHQSDVTLQDLPSSTSVFRTASGQVQHRSRSVVPSSIT